jgi:hypothetical protein
MSNLVLFGAALWTGYLIMGPAQILKYSSLRSYFNPKDPTHSKYNPNFFVTAADYNSSQDAFSDFWDNQSRRPHGTFGLNDIPPDARYRY